MSVAVLQKAVGISGPLSCFEAFSSSSCANVGMKEKETTLIERTWEERLLGAKIKIELLAVLVEKDSASFCIVSTIQRTKS